MQAQNVQDVLVQLDHLIKEFREARSRSAFFAALYRGVTARIQAGIAAGRFADSDRMERFDTAFANRYFAAVDAARTGQAVPRSWRVAFDATRRPGTMILQHLLLGMSAHINFDLPLAAASAGLDTSLPDWKEDFLAINAILGALLDPAQEAIGEFSPFLDVLDRVGGRSDEAIATFSMVHAREEAWHEANRLAREPADLRDRSILSLDRRVALLGERIIVPGGPVGLAIELIARTESEDVPAITDRLLAMT